MLALFTVLHFLVDGICGAVLAAYAVDQPFLEPIVYYFGLYNAFAFGTQWLTGYLFDRKGNWIRGSFLAASLLLTAGSLLPLGIGLQTVLLGMGNSIFHVAAGSLVLKRYRTYKELGIFVSSGAIGLALGLNRFVGPYPFVAACLMLSVLATYMLCRKNAWQALLCQGEAAGGPAWVKPAPGLQGTGPGQCSSNNEGNQAGSVSETAPVPGGSFALASLISLFLLLGCVVLRGLGSGNTASPYVMLFPCIFAAGKALGGLVCDRAGYPNTILGIFLLCFLALLVSGLAGSALLVLAFNMTMPLTLRLAHWCSPRHPGLMFGLAAGCLLPGVYYREFSLAPQAMAVLQFLCLAAAGWLLWKKTGRPEMESK